MGRVHGGTAEGPECGGCDGDGGLVEDGEGEGNGGDEKGGPEPA